MSAVDLRRRLMACYDPLGAQMKIAMITLIKIPYAALHDSRCSSAGLASGGPSRSAFALLLSAIANASSNENRPDANVKQSLAG